MNQSKFLAISHKLREAREKSRAKDGTGFGLVENCRQIFKPNIKRSNHNRVNRLWQSFENCSNKRTNLTVPDENNTGFIPRWSIIQLLLNHVQQSNRA